MEHFGWPPGASGVGDVTAILKSAVADSDSKDVARLTFWKIALLRHKELEAFELETLPPNRPKPKKRKGSGGKAAAKDT